MSVFLILGFVWLLIPLRKNRQTFKGRKKHVEILHWTWYDNLHFWYSANSFKNTQECALYIWWPRWECCFLTIDRFASFPWLTDIYMFARVSHFKAVVFFPYFSPWKVHQLTRWLVILWMLLVFPAPWNLLLNACFVSLSGQYWHRHANVKLSKLWPSPQPSSNEKQPQMCKYYLSRKKIFFLFTEDT